MKRSVTAAKNLKDLRDRLNALDEDEIRAVDLASLPVFSKREVRHTSEVWSWDKTHILVNNHYGDEPWAIEPRCKICGEAVFHCHHDQG